MNTILQRRHRISTLCAFFFFSIPVLFLLAQDELPPIGFSADPVDQSRFFFAADNPIVFTDIEEDGLIFDGCLNLPQGNYQIPSAFQFTPMDSAITHTFFDYFQGDYNYRHINVGERIRLNDIGVMTFTANARSFLGQYGTLGPQNSSGNNILQNYRLHFDKFQETGSTELAFQYHTENAGLPIETTVYSNRAVESFHLGGKFTGDWRSVNYYFHSVLQLGHYNLEYSRFDHHALWGIGRIDHKLGDRWKIGAEIERKVVGIDSLFKPVKSNRYTLFRTLVNRQVDRLDLSAGMGFLAKNFYPVFKAAWDSPIAVISLERGIGNALNVDPLFELKNRDYPFYRLLLSRKTGMISGSLQFLQIDWESESIPLVYGQLGIDFSRWRLPWLTGTISGHWMDSEEVIFDQHFETRLQIKPTLKNKRFKPFAAVSYDFLNISGYQVMDLQSHSGTSEYGFTWNTQNVNLEFGLEVKNFIFSYHMDRILPDGSEFSSEILPLTQLNYFRVLWIFEN